MPVPYRDQEDVEALGTASYLHLEATTDPAGYRGALFGINARGEPMEFTYNRVETPNTFLWRPGDVQRAAARKLTTSLFELCPEAPNLLLCLSTETPRELFSQDLTLSIPVGWIVTSLQDLGRVEAEPPERVAGDEIMHIFWYPTPPEEGSPGRLLFQLLVLHGLLLEPFERAAIGLRELYGAAHPGQS